MLNSSIASIGQGLSEHAHRDTARMISETTGFGNIDAIAGNDALEKNGWMSAMVRRDRRRDDGMGVERE